MNLSPALLLGASLLVSLVLCWWGWAPFISQHLKMPPTQQEVRLERIPRELLMTEQEFQHLNSSIEQLRQSLQKIEAELQDLKGRSLTLTPPSPQVADTQPNMPSGTSSESKTTYRKFGGRSTTKGSG